CNATLSGSQTPMASRMNVSSARFSRIRKIAVFDVRPFTYEGLALPICSQSFGLAPSSAPNSTYKAFFDVPANAARLARLNTSPGSSGFGGVPRSEEHTSELQSRFDLVCRLLLQKKNK